MTDPKPVDSEGIITFNSVQSSREQEHAESVDYNTADELPESGSVSGEQVSNRNVQVVHMSSDSAMAKMSEMMTGVASTLKDVVSQLRDLKHSTAQHSAGLGSNPFAGNLRGNDYSYHPEFMPRVYNDVMPNCQQEVYCSEAQNQFGYYNNSPFRHFGNAFRPDTQENVSRNNGDCGNQNNSRNDNMNQPNYSSYNTHPVQYGMGDLMSYQGQRRPYDSLPIKIPPFTGNEDWAVWLTRFEAIAERKGWSESQMLDQLLPRLDGQAAEFVFSQLHASVLHNYRELKTELSNRYRVIETARLYASRFSRRAQRINETAEQFAAELKVLYDKAHGYRDKKTRDEDLVRRFLDGLRENEVRFAVEYNKEPQTIDEAVFHVVNYIQTRNIRDQKGRDNLRRTSQEGETEEYQSDDNFFFRKG